MRPLVAALALGALCAGCAGVDWFRDRLEGRSEAAQLVARADELVRDGRPSAARDLYDRVVREPARDAVHARALYSLARLYVDPSSGLRDYRAAQVALERLLAEYPKGEWEADARAWRAALAELLTREAEAAHLKHEATKVRAELQRLKRIDLNLERRR
ncbi:MAG TPA: hypothetical protein VFO18_11210 [Methylomirabilota bacterium]|nr:hypothetical protein [Methylomirabilota bacterium]